MPCCCNNASRPLLEDVLPHLISGKILQHDLTQSRMADPLVHVIPNNGLPAHCLQKWRKMLQVVRFLPTTCTHAGAAAMLTLVATCTQTLTQLLRSPHAA